MVDFGWWWWASVGSPFAINVPSGGRYWSWGKLCIRGCSRYMEKSLYTPSIFCEPQTALKKMKSKEKRKTKKKNPSDLFHTHDLSHLMLSGFTYCMLYPVKLCRVNWTCFKKPLSLYNWKVQSTRSDPQCCVSTLVMTSLAVTPGACSCSGNVFHFPRFFSMSAGATEGKWTWSMISRLLENPAIT